MVQMPRVFLSSQCGPNSVIGANAQIYIYVGIYDTILNPAELTVSPCESDEVPASLRSSSPLPDVRYLYV